MKSVLSLREAISASYALIQASRLNTILYSADGPDIPIAHYLNAVPLLGHQCLAQILEEGFGFVPAEE